MHRACWRRRCRHPSTTPRSSTPRRRHLGEEPQAVLPSAAAHRARRSTCGSSTPTGVASSTATTTSRTSGTAIRASSRRRRAQAARLNTNTRYLHETILAYAERLARTLPAALDAFYFVQLGERGQRPGAATGPHRHRRHDVVVLDWAYHGHTQALIEVSPYKYKRPGGAGPPPCVHVAAAARSLPRARRLAAARRRRALRGRGRRRVLGEAARPARRPPSSPRSIAERAAARCACPRLPGRGLRRDRAPPAGCASPTKCRWVRPCRHAHVGVRDARRRARHRDVGQAGGQRPSAWRVVTTPRDRRSRSPTAWSTSTPSAAIPSRAPSAWPCWTCSTTSACWSNAVTAGRLLLDGFRALADRYPAHRRRARSRPVPRHRVGHRPPDQGADGATASAVVQRARGLGVLMGTDGPTTT